MRLADEARIDRELAWRPHLGFEITFPASADSPVISPRHVLITLSNVGNGPALSTSIWIYYYDNGACGWDKREDLLVASKQTLATVGIPLDFPGPSQAEFPTGMFDPPTNRRHNGNWVFVATCTDVLGNHWRFVHGRSAEIVRPGDNDLPPWTQWL
jgi:hypothetical protein